MINIYDATIEDARVLSLIHSACFDRGWSQKEFEDLFQRRNAVCQGQMIGEDWVSFSILVPMLDEMELLSIAVLPNQRGQKLGAALLGHQISILKSRNVRRLLLEVAEDNVSAKALYTQLGFATDGRRPKYYRRSEGAAIDAILMSLTLKTA